MLNNSNNVILKNIAYVKLVFVLTHSKKKNGCFETAAIAPHNCRFGSLTDKSAAEKKQWK